MAILPCGEAQNDQSNSLICLDILEKKYVVVDDNDNEMPLKAIYYPSKPYLYIQNDSNTQTIHGIVPDIIASVHEFCGIQIQLAHETTQSNMSVLMRNRRHPIDAAIPGDVLINLQTVSSPAFQGLYNFTEITLATVPGMVVLMPR